MKINRRDFIKTGGMVMLGSLAAVIVESTSRRVAYPNRKSIM